MLARIYTIAAALITLGTFVICPALGVSMGFRPWMSVAVIGPALAMILVSLAFRATDAALESVARRARLLSLQSDRTQDRRDAHGLGLPYIESDGTISWPPVTLPKPTPEQVHRDLHARRLAAQPGIIHVPGAGWTVRHRD